MINNNRWGKYLKKLAAKLPTAVTWSFFSPKVAQTSRPMHFSLIFPVQKRSCSFDFSR